MELSEEVLVLAPGGGVRGKREQHQGQGQKDLFNARHITQNRCLGYPFRTERSSKRTGRKSGNFIAWRHPAPGACIPTFGDYTVGMEQKLVLLAIGGNALLKPGEKGSVDEQEANANATCDLLLPLIQPRYNLVVTHGNGPQVGNILLRSEVAKETVPPMPLDVCVAESEGSMGYFMQQGLLNAIRRAGIRRYVVTLITQVMVDPEDPAFKNPTKPIGPFYTEDEAKILMKQKRWVMKEDAKRGWRRLVASPKPHKVVQRFMIRDLANAGNVVIAVGGGGVPIMKGKHNNYEGVEAVIDKDLASANLAAVIKADMFIILTAVPYACLNYKQPNEKRLERLTAAEAEKFLKEGHFAAGSMGPKIEACINYIKAGGIEAVITDPEHLDDALKGKAGTFITR
jgi:carbamate kinase